MITNNTLVFNILFMVAICFLIPAIVYIIYGSIEYHNYNIIKPYKCNITVIDYPKIIPSIHNKEGWIQCSNGGFDGCMKWYANDVSSLVIRKIYRMTYLDNAPSIDDHCTYRYGDCDSSLIVMRKLIQDMTAKQDQVLNTNVTCYYESLDSYIYLHKEHGMTSSQP